ncbi:HD-GYP domain-containing protein [Treponema sp.]|uniref:HD-GYP domain-containing protein n=1 Tax=Treponema sp. TaxID=166 RepID=UPI003890A2BA
MILQDLWSKIRTFLGFYKNPPYVENLLKEADIRSARNISFVVICLEIWMLIRQVVKYHSKFTSLFNFFSYTWGYWILLSAAALIFVYSVLYLSGKLNILKKFARLFIFLYFALGIYFGMMTSLHDISKGRMITCFLNMTLIATVIMIWRPFISLIITATFSLLFVYLVNHVYHTVQGNAWFMGEGELINYTMFMIALMITAITMYLQRHRDAQKAYDLQKAHEHEIELMKKEQEHLGELFSQTAAALASAIDAKDRYTHGHSNRVAEYSREIAKRAGKTENEINEIYFAALLHDVGKIGVSGAIINKNGKLNDEEFNEIKKHPVWGWEILSNITHSPYLSIGAHYHHEKYNGKGYPEGLSGEDIPDTARIIAVADAYDAMTSKRSYRDTLAQSVVRSEIEKGTGSQFDPKYAEIMLKMIDEDTEYTMKE